ncbi:MAG: peptidoglycan DD-metalloendopeptidase family protein [Woeseiaceae bacterium]|nr:peptidoglycan DD-metalloendopeptidase family protein [Woeseiaceae bacterium]
MNARLSIAILLALLLAACGSAPSWQEREATHIVRTGETLFSIAWRYGHDPDDLARWNRIGDGSLIHPGQVIRLTPPPGSSRNTSRSAATPRPSARPLPQIPARPSPKWAWPVQGRINVEFGAKPGPGTGVLINGKAGQPILAAASGRVVYAGSGLIGYGQLIILKHNDTYLSAYGYTASLLVKEGEQVNQGQRIATMGEGPERKPRLHFEIRRNGKPVNPRQFLPAR